MRIRSSENLLGGLNVKDKQGASIADMKNSRADADHSVKLAEGERLVGIHAHKTEYD